MRVRGAENCGVAKRRGTATDGPGVSRRQRVERRAKFLAALKLAPTVNLPATRVLPLRPPRPLIRSHSFRGPSSQAIPNSQFSGALLFRNRTRFSPDRL